MIGTFFLFIFTSLLASIVMVMGFTYSLIRGIFKGGLKDYFYYCAFTIDQAGTVVCQHLFNDWLVKPDGHRFGNPDETISFVLGVNLRFNKLYPFGVGLCKVVDFFAYLFSGERNHCINASKKEQ